MFLGKVVRVFQKNMYRVFRGNKLMIAKDKTNNRNVFIMIGLSQNADNPSMKSNHRPIQIRPQ